MTARTSTSCISRRGSFRRSAGFWSLTMYDANYFFVANPINRYSISARQNLKANADGSIDLYIQKHSPGADKESQLAARAGRQVRPDAADVLAERKIALDHQRDVVAAGSQEERRPGRLDVVPLDQDLLCISSGGLFLIAHLKTLAHRGQPSAGQQHSDIAGRRQATKMPEPAVS